MHVDMDMFYAAVEMRDNPSLRDVPMAVGGVGMLSTSNYLARKFGVRAAMPGFIGKKLCPQLVIVPGNMEKYSQVSQVVRAVFREYDPNFAPMSLDEAYLDITDILAKKRAEDGEVTACSLVNEMRGKIEERTELTASAGIAPNCFLAKVCSDLNKPDGQYELAPQVDIIAEFVSKLVIRKVGGIGNVQEQLLRGIGVETCGDLYRSRAEIRLLFSELSSDFYLAVSQGIGSTRLEPPEERERKSISTESTFSETSERRDLLNILSQLCKDLASDCREKNILGQSVTVKIKSHDFKIKSKVAQMCEFSNDENILFATAKRLLIHLLDTSEDQPLALRLMGVRLSVLKDKDESSSSRPKQKNLLSYLVDNKDGREETGSSSRYECPVCHRNFDHLNTLYDHVDVCLSGDPSKEVTSCDIEKSDCESKGAENHESIAREDPPVVNIDEASLSAQAGAGLDLVCPVCGSERYREEAQLSRHVEECLNKQTIAELLRTDRAHTAPVATVKKRKASHTEKRSPKKSRCEFTKTIDTFFKLKS